MPYIVPDAVREPLYCIVPYFNPWRWKSREKHTIRAVKHFQDAGAVVVLVEAAFNRRELAFANSGLDGAPAQCGVLGSDHRFRHKYIGLRTKDELWLKENLIRVAVTQLPWDFQQVCWIDSDVHFMRPNWVGECIHKLQHYKFLQMFSHARDVGPDYEVLPENYPHSDGPAFVRAWLDGGLSAIDPQGRKPHPPHPPRPPWCPPCPCPPDPPPDPYPPYYGKRRIWPGLAWACTREAWDQVGGLLDFAIWGGGDYHMAYALVEDRRNMMHPGLHANYKNMVNEWANLCERHIRKNVGVMTGSIIHNWHGRKTDRGYGAKHNLLAHIGFDPLKHLKRDYQGLWQLHDDGSESFVRLRDEMRAIAHERDEDSNDTRLDLWDQGH